MPTPCIIPVNADAALEWLQGRLHDGELLLRAPLRPECVFILDLPDRRSYVECVRAVMYWADRGAVCVIARTSHATVQSHILKNGGVKGWLEPYGDKRRLMLPPDGFRGWLDKIRPRI